MEDLGSSQVQWGWEQHKGPYFCTECGGERAGAGGGGHRAGRGGLAWQRGSLTCPGAETRPSPQSARLWRGLRVTGPAPRACSRIEWTVAGQGWGHTAARGPGPSPSCSC